MAPLTLEGNSLGKRHQHYNSLLKDAISNKIQAAKIDYSKTDVENLFNIDIASNNKDVDYILDVLKGDDMLYVSRAIKQSNWLINDDQFDHIIEPQYLHSELFPLMMPKASCKFLLHIRLSLKDECRIEEFFEYIKENRDIKTAFKWLPYCSLSFIEDIVSRHAKDISSDILRRLCKRSSTVLEIFVKSHDGYKTGELQAAMILLRSNTEKYFDALSNYNRYSNPNFGKKQTAYVMKKCPHRFIDNFEKYMYFIHIDTFAKYLKKEDIESFIIQQLENKTVKSFLDQEQISIFMKHMPAKGKCELIQKLIDDWREEQDTKNDSAVGLMFGEVPFIYATGGPKNSNGYHWYTYAPFDVTFADFKKRIRMESNPDERNAMLMILVTNARSNFAHIRSLLQYYRENHINDPFKFKVQFVNDLLEKTAINLYDDQMWNILDEIFRSMEVYVESKNNVQTCIKAIIVRKITRNQPVPAIIEQKFNFDSLQSIQRKLNVEQKNKLFAYLYNIFWNKLNKYVISNNAELTDYVELFKHGLNLLKDWKKDLIDFPLLINKIKDCAKIKKETGWNTSLAPLYNTKKNWKKILFHESVILAPSHIVLMNALKHDAELLERNKEEVETLRFNDAVSLKQVLRKLRVYWPHTMATEWVSKYRKKLDNPSGHKAVVRGLCFLLNQQQLIDFLKKYEPLETKVNWADTDELRLSVQKNIARSMHIARPQIKPDAVLAYAKGDYVQFTQPALNAIFYNVKLSISRECVLQLLNGITSLQKHGINLAFSKLSSTELEQIFPGLWRSNANPSVRAAIFQYTYELLCTEHDEELIAELWKTMQMYMDSLTAEENKRIFNTFGRLSNVHFSIKPALCMKSYKFLKSLPPKADCKIIISKMKEEMNNIIEHLDSDFVESIILEFIEQILLTRTYGYSHRHDVKLLVSYLLKADDKSTQLQRFEAVFVPFMKKSFLLWHETDERCYYVRENLQNILVNLYNSTIAFAFNSEKVKPIAALYSNILAELENALPITQHYILFRQLKLTIAFINILNKDQSDYVENRFKNVAIDFKDVVALYLKEDIGWYGLSIYTLFGKAFSKMLNELWISRSIQLHYLKTFLDDKNLVYIYLLVIELMDAYFNGDDQKEDVKKVHELLGSHPSPEVEMYYCEKFGEFSIKLQKDTNVPNIH